MYTIKIDDTLVYDPRLPDYRIQEAVLKQQINKAGSFTVTLPSKHPKRTLAQRLKSTILVRQDNVTIFRGRILNEKSDFYGSRQLTCEGQLAFFNDSIVRPYEYSGSVEGYLQRLIDSHNSQVPADRQFSLGNVTVTDPNDFIVRASEQYPTTWDEINDKLLDLLGGYLIPRVEGNTVYIDYLSDINTKNLQDVEFGKNLLDLSQIIKGQDIATVIIPLGSRQEDGSRVTIASVNDGKDYVENTEAISMYGRITKTVYHDDVTSPSNLLRKGNEDLQQSALQAENINATAADLSFAGYDIQSFRFARYERVISSPHGLSAFMLVSQITTDLLHPEKGKLTLGRTRKTFTGTQMEVQGEQKKENLSIFETAEEARKQAEDAKNLAQSSKTLTVVLDNESHTVPTDTNGANGDYTGCSCGVLALYGSADVTANAAITAAAGSGVTGTWDAAGHRYTVTNLSGDSGTVEFTVTYNSLTVVKTMSISKARAGAVGQDGETGKTSYLHLKYSNDGGETFTGEVDEDRGTQVALTAGLFRNVSTGELQGLTYYYGTGEPIVLEQGVSAMQIKTANISGNPTSFVHFYTASGEFISCWSYKPEDTDYADVPIPEGTCCIHVCTYSNAVRTINQKVRIPEGESPGDYIGQYTDFIEADSTDPGKYTWTRIKGDPGAAGAAGRTYFIEPSVLVIKKGADDVLTPTSVTFASYYRDGTEASRTAYAGRFIIQESADGSTWTDQYTSSADESSKEYTLSSPDIVMIRCTLYAAGGTVNALDSQSVVVVTDADNIDLDPIYQEINNTYTNATKTANEIMMEAVKEYVRTSDWETFRDQMATQFTQSAESVDIIFERLTEQIKTLEGDTTSEFAVWRKYIRFIDGSIVLGQEENPLILTLVNDRISFTNNGVEVAYFSNNQMYVSNMAVTESADLCGLKITVDENGDIFIS